MKYTVEENRQIDSWLAENYPVNIVVSLYREAYPSNPRTTQGLAEHIKKRKATLSSRVPEAPARSIQHYENIDKALTTALAERDFYKRAYKSRIKAEIFEDRLISAVKPGILSLPAPKIYSPKPRSVDHKTYEEAVLLVSDIHAGDDVSHEVTGGIAEYNIPRMCSRLQHLADTTSDWLVRHLQNHEFGKLHVWGLGDWVSGMIHDELIWASESTVIEWLGSVVLIMSQFLNDLSRFYPISFTGLPGNHGRIFPKKHYKNRYVNWDYIAYNMISLILSHNDRVKFDIPKSFWALKDVQDYKFVLMHGDDIKWWNNVPWYGIKRAYDSFQRLLLRKKSSPQVFQYMALAHFHQEFTTTNVIANGSVVGDSEFSIGQGYSEGSPSQTLFGVHRDHGVTWRMPIDLANIPSGQKLRYSFKKDSALAEQVRGALGV